MKKQQKNNLQAIIFIIIAICIIVGMECIYPKYISKNTTKATASKSNNSSVIKYSKTPINVTMDVVPETIDENNTKFKITTNLPDNTNLGIKISSEDDDFYYSKQQMLIVYGGEVETDSFNSNNLSLPNGNYSIKIVTATEPLQDYKSVRAILGENGCNLQGDCISDSKDGQDKIVNFTKNITITDSLTKVFDAEPNPKIGMTADELLGCNWGKPQNINTTTTADGKEEQWCYSGYRYIYVDNGVVTTIQN